MRSIALSDDPGPERASRRARLRRLLVVSENPVAFGDCQNRSRPVAALPGRGSGRLDFSSLASLSLASRSPSR
jgi:hypothetical protein